jgi:hypothetical protein
MKLGRQKKPKHSQAADALASVTKVWAEWQLGKKASKGVAKAKALRPPGKVKRILSLKWVKVGGAVAVAGGTAAAVGRKLKGDDPASYTGPPPSAAADVAVPAPDTPAPLTVAPDPATQERDTETVGGESTLRPNRDDATDDSEPADPELVSDSADEAEPAAAEPAAEPVAVADDAGGEDSDDGEDDGDPLTGPGGSSV